jgi:hypothetical protein
MTLLNLKIRDQRSWTAEGREIVPVKKTIIFSMIAKTYSPCTEENTVIKWQFFPSKTAKHFSTSLQNSKCFLHLWRKKIAILVIEKNMGHTVTQFFIRNKKNKKGHFLQDQSITCRWKTSFPLGSEPIFDLARSERALKM